MWEYMTQFRNQGIQLRYATADTGGNAYRGPLSIYRLVVDTGRRKGHITQRIKELYPDIKGPIIPQDWLDVIDDISGELPGIDRMKYDFFAPQSIKGIH